LVKSGQPTEVPPGRVRLIGEPVFVFPAMCLQRPEHRRTFGRTNKNGKIKKKNITRGVYEHLFEALFSHRLHGFKTTIKIKIISDQLDK
jgi:hypothetical protein